MKNKLGIYRVYPLKVGNKTFRVPIRKGVGFSNFVHSELWMEELLKTFGSNKTKFLDVGLNVGQTLLKWKEIYPNEAYIGFKPNPNCIAYLNKLIKENKFDLVKIVVDGAELFVLKSLFEVCQNAIIICEILPVYSNDNKDRLERQQEIEALLKKHDYLIFRILKPSTVQLELTEEIGIHSELSKSDSVFAPKSKCNLHPIFGQ